MTKPVEITRAIVRIAAARPGFFLVGWLFVVLFVTLWPFRFFGRNNVSVEEGYGAHFRLPATVYTSHPVSMPFESRRWTMAMEIIPGQSGCECPGIIALWGFDRRNCNIMVGQDRDNLQVFLGDRGEHMYFRNVLPPGRRSQLVVVADSDSTRYFINGMIMGAEPAKRSQWAHFVPSAIVFGSDAHGNENWEGEIVIFTIVDGTMGPEEVFQPKQMFDRNSAILLYQFGLAHDGHIINQGRVSDADLVIPSSFTPYRRAYFQNPPLSLHELQAGRDDFLLNIVMFLPGGYLLTLVLTRKGMSHIWGWLLATFVGLLLTLGIEALQVFLPGRGSSWLDVASNTLGAMVGAMGANVLNAVQERLMKILQLRSTDI